MGKKEMLVSAIENGTVIDHIPAEKTYEVVDLLGLRESDTPVTIGYNLPSKKIGRKGIIKITDKFFSNEEISRLSVVAPKIVLNIIKDYEVYFRNKAIFVMKDFAKYILLNFINALIEEKSINKTESEIPHSLSNYFYWEFDNYVP